MSKEPCMARQISNLMWRDKVPSAGGLLVSQMSVDTLISNTLQGSILCRQRIALCSVTDSFISFLPFSGAQCALGEIGKLI